MTIIEFLKRFEGVSNKVYRDSVGLPTIGVGHLLKKEDGLVLGDEVTDDIVNAFLILDIMRAGLAVKRYVFPYVKLTSNQLIALTSFVFNFGPGAFKTSTLLSKVNSNNFVEAAKEFDRWIHAGDKVVKGLVTRRKAEKLLFTREDIVTMEDLDKAMKESSN